MNIGEAVEAMTTLILGEANEGMQALAKDRDELLAALKSLLGRAVSESMSEWEPAEFTDARALIKRIEEKAKA